MYRRSRPLAIPQPQPRPAFRPFPSGRYARMNPLCRWFNLHLLAEPLPAAVGTALIRAWMHPGHFDGNQAIQNLYRQRYEEATLPSLPPSLLGNITQIELLVTRRIVEAPRTEIPREARSALLRSQAAYLYHVYAALVAQLGEAAAHAEFERRLLSMR